MDSFAFSDLRVTGADCVLRAVLDAGALDSSSLRFLRGKIELRAAGTLRSGDKTKLTFLARAFSMIHMSAKPIPDGVTTPCFSPV